MLKTFFEKQQIHSIFQDLVLILITNLDFVVVYGWQQTSFGGNFSKSTVIQLMKQNKRGKTVGCSPKTLFKQLLYHINLTSGFFQTTLSRFFITSLPTCGHTGYRLTWKFIKTFHTSSCTSIKRMMYFQFVVEHLLFRLTTYYLN